MERILKREKLKKLLSFVLSLTMIFTLVQVNNITVRANEAETYSYSLGTGDDAGKLIATCNGECGNEGDHVYKLKLTAKNDFASKMSNIYEGLSVTDESGKDISDNANAWIAAGIEAPVVEYYWEGKWNKMPPSQPGNYSARMYPASDNTKIVSTDFSVLSDKLSFMKFTLKHNEDGSYVITSADNPEDLPIIVGAMTKYYLGPNPPEIMHDYLVSDSGYGSYAGMSIDGQFISGEEWTIKTVKVGESFSFDPVYENEEVGIFVGTYYDTWMENFFNYYRLYSLGMTDALQKGESGDNVLIHKHSWNSVVKDNKLYIFCSNTRGDCDCQGSSANLENAYMFSLDLTEDEHEYDGNPYDGAGVYDKNSDTVDLDDEFMAKIGLKLTYVGRDGTTYAENEAAPAKLGKYTVNLYSSCDTTQKISADFEIVVPAYTGDADKVVAYEDSDFEYIFYKDGSYTSDVAGDESGTVGEAVTFFNATENMVLCAAYELMPGKFSNEIVPDYIPSLSEGMKVPNGVGLKCKYVAADKKMSLIPVTHLHKWNISADDSTLTAECICDNTIAGYEGCDYKDKTGNDRKIVIAIEARNHEYGEYFTSIAKDANKTEYNPDDWNQICKELRLNTSHKGRGNTVYVETDTPPVKPGKYTFSIFSEDASDVKATSDYEILLPQGAGDDKVLVCADEDFDYRFYKDGSYTSDVADDTNGIFGEELAIFNATGDTVYFEPAPFDEIYNGEYGKFDKSYIQSYFSVREIEDGVGIEFKYVAAEKLIYTYPLVHEDVWDISVEGSTLKAVCKCDESTECYNVCDFKDKSLEERTFIINLSGEEKMELSGNPYTVSLLDDSMNEVPEEVLDLLGIIVRFVGRDNTEYNDTTAPYQAGKYTVKLYSSKATEKIVSSDFEITLTNPSGVEKLLQGGTESWTYKFYKDGAYISGVVGDESGTLTGDAAIINVLNIQMDIYRGNIVSRHLDCTEYKKLSVSDILKDLGKEDALGIECTYIYGENRSYFFIEPIEHEHETEYSVIDSQNGKKLKVVFKCDEGCRYYNSDMILSIDVTPEMIYGTCDYEDVVVHAEESNSNWLSDIWEYGLKITYTGTGDTVYPESTELPKKVGTYIAQIYPISETTPEHVISDEFSIVIPKDESGVKYLSCVNSDWEYDFYLNGTYTSNVKGDESGEWTYDERLHLFNASGSDVEEKLGVFGQVADTKYSGNNSGVIYEIALGLGGESGVGAKFVYDAYEKTVSIAPIVHKHEWLYNVDDTDIFAICKCDDTIEGYSGCEFNGKSGDDRKASMNISITSDSFTDSLPDDAITVGDWTSDFKGLGKASDIYYVSQDKVTYTESKTKPSEAGKYYAKVYLLDEKGKNIKDANGDEVYVQVAFSIIKEVTVSFAGGKGTTGSVDSKKGNSFDKITLPENGFTKAGYTFNGWTDGVNTYKAGVEYTIPASDITLTAKWKQDTYSVSFSGGKDVTGNAPSTIKAHYNDKIALPKNTFTKKGYKFAGWTDGSKVYKEGVNYTVTKTVTLTAKWDKLPQYTISFVGGSGATGSAPKAIKGYEKDSIKLPKNTFKKSGYEFTGWSDGKKTYKEGAKYAIPAKNVKFTAVWKQTDATLTFIERCYVVALGRDSDPEGLKYWQDKLANYKYCGAQVGYGFIFSDEYKSRNTTDEQFIKDLYKMFFDREPDQTGYDYWIGQMKNKTSREEVFAGFANSDEFFDLCSNSQIARGIYIPGYDIEKQGGVNGYVARLYKVCLDRLPEKDGHAYWVNKLIAGEKTGTDVSREFILSDEFMGLKLSDEAYVGKLYSAFFGREGDPAGIAYWLGELKNNKSREEVFNGFAASNEFKDLCKNFGIQP